MRGFDYLAGKEIDLRSKEWRERLQSLVKRGGFRRAENGETFGHNERGRIKFEVYDNVQLKNEVKT